MNKWAKWVKCCVNLILNIYESFLQIMRKRGGIIKHSLLPFFFAVDAAETFHGWLLLCTGNECVSVCARVCLSTCVWLLLLGLILLRCVTSCRAYYRNHYIPICNGLLWWEYNKPVTHKMVFTLKDETSSCVITLSLLTDSPSDLWEGHWLLLHTCQQASSETKTMGILPVGVKGEGCLLFGTL